MPTTAAHWIDQDSGPLLIALRMVRCLAKEKFWIRDKVHIPSSCMHTHIALAPSRPIECLFMNAVHSERNHWEKFASPRLIPWPLLPFSVVSQLNSSRTETISGLHTHPHRHCIVRLTTFRWPVGHCADWTGLEWLTPGNGGADDKHWPSLGQ